MIEFLVLLRLVNILFGFIVILVGSGLERSLNVWIDWLKLGWVWGGGSVNGWGCGRWCCCWWLWNGGKGGWRIGWIFKVLGFIMGFGGGWCIIGIEGEGNWGLKVFLGGWCIEINCL